MAAKVVRTHGQRTCAVEVSPSEVDAGAELTVTVRVACPDGCDLRGQSVSIRHQDDTELASAELTELDGEAYVTSPVVLRAPLSVGEHTYQAILPAHEKDEVLHEETATEFSFVGMAHAASVNVWGLPSAIAAGERFRFNVGIKCSAGCKARKLEREACLRMSGRAPAPFILPKWKRKPRLTLETIGGRSRLPART
jgi:hypothetical protein